MPWQACYTDGTGYTACSGRGLKCLLPKVTAEPPGTDFPEPLPGAPYFIHTKMTAEERKNTHDDILEKLTVDINNLIQEAQKKKPDHQIGIMVTPLGLFFRYNSKTPPAKEWFEKATLITDENVVELLKLTGEKIDK